MALAQPSKAICKRKLPGKGNKFCDFRTGLM